MLELGGIDRAKKGVLPVLRPLLEGVLVSKRQLSAKLTRRLVYDQANARSDCGFCFGLTLLSDSRKLFSLAEPFYSSATDHRLENDSATKA